MANVDRFAGAQLVVSRRLDNDSTRGSAPLTSGGPVEIRIGIKHSPRELAFDTDSSADEVRRVVEEAITNSAALVSLSDVKGHQYLVNTEAIAYIELGGEGGRKVGFIS
ncbi:DUF3107 domain-containing protein [Leucobacter sp. NPDC058333]|uniref:DUF3107 domain-containing protein n=1 Tax=Leucobacter sp. NPDC058333 TaxID=3346450 RepID=UPI0036465126